MAEFPHMPMYWGDYLSKTSHLSTEEHGAYLLVLAAMWLHGGYVPDDDTKLARIARMSLGKWKRIAPTIRAFLTPTEFGLTQNRLQVQREKVLEKSKKNSANACERWGAKSLENKHVADANASANAYPNEDADGHALGMPVKVKDKYSTSTVLPLTSFEKEPSRPEPPEAAGQPIDFRTELFRRGLDTIISLTGKSAPAARTLLGRWLKDAEEEAVVVLEAIDAAVEARPADPVPWVNQAIKHRMEQRGSRAPPKRTWASV